MEVVKVKLTELHEDPFNARLHNQTNIDSIKSSLLENDQYQPLVVQKSSMKVVVGNGRFVAMQELGWTEAWCVVKDLDESQATALGIADNRTAELAEWDYDTLDTLLHNIEDVGLSIPGVDADFHREIDAMVGTIDFGKGPDTDETDGDTFKESIAFKVVVKNTGAFEDVVKAVQAMVDEHSSWQATVEL